MLILDLPDWLTGFIQVHWEFQPGHRNWQADSKVHMGVPKT